MSATAFQRRRRIARLAKIKELEERNKKLGKMKIEELKEFAKEIGIEFDYKVNKTELLKLLKGGE